MSESGVGWDRNDHGKKAEREPIATFACILHKNPFKSQERGQMTSSLYSPLFLVKENLEILWFCMSHRIELNHMSTPCYDEVWKSFWQRGTQ